MKALLKALLFRGLIKFGVSAGLKSKAPKYILANIIAAILILLSSIFALIAVHQLLLEHFDRPIVNLLFAAGFILLALITLITIAIKRKQHEKTSVLDKSLQTLEEYTDRAQVKAKSLGSKAELAIRRKPKNAWIGVAVVALILGWRSGRKGR